MKSESASIKIPEIDLFLSDGIIGGKLTNLKDLIKSIHKRLVENIPFTSKNPSLSPKFDLIIEKLSNILNGTFEKFTLVLRDPLSNFFIELIEGNDDGKLVVADDDITEKENEDLGQNETERSNNDDYFTGNCIYCLHQRLFFYVDVNELNDHRSTIQR